MITLADEIVAHLPALMLDHPQGPSARIVADRLGADIGSVRTAFIAADKSGRARIVRRGRGRGGALYLVTPDYPGRICIICHREFSPVRRETRTCSHSCARHLAWQNEDMRARHRESLKRARQAPEVRQRMSEHSRRFSRTPEERARRSENNRRSWADPEARLRRLQSIDKAWTGPEAAERREKAAKKKRELWSDPAWRERVISRMKNGKRQAVQRRIVDLAQSFPEMTPAEIGERVGRTEEGVQVVLRRARKDGLIGPRPGDGPRLRLKAKTEGAPA